MSGPIRWLDLHVDGDEHARRCDSPDTLRAYLRRVERLSEEAIEELLARGEVGPPLARRSYRITPLEPA